MPTGIVSPTDVRTIRKYVYAEYSTGLTVQNSYRPETISKPAASRSTPATLTRSDDSRLRQCVEDAVCHTISDVYPVDAVVSLES